MTGTERSHRRSRFEDGCREQRDVALVTGAAGFIGSNLVRELLRRGFAVRGFDDLSGGRLANLEGVFDHGAFEFHEGDLRSTADVERAVRDVTYVFHHAALVSVPESIEDPHGTMAVNTSGTANLLVASNAADVDSIVVASSAAVYGSGGELPKSETMATDPESPYALSKYDTERLAMQFCHHHDLDTVALRYFNVYGPRQDPQGDYAAVIPTFIRLMTDGERPTIYGDGEQTRDFVHVDDVIEANLAAVTSDVGGEIINVARGKGVSINRLVDRLNDVLGTEIEPEYDPPRPGDVRHSYADISKAETMLGFEPSVGLDEGLRDTVRYFERNRP